MEISSYTTGYGLMFVAAGISMIAAAGSGIGQGLIASKALEAIGRNPEEIKKIRATMLLAMAITESTAIYSLIVSLVILFVFAGTN